MCAKERLRLNLQPVLHLLWQRLCVGIIVGLLMPVFAQCSDPKASQDNKSPKPIPEEIVLKVEKFDRERTSLAAKDLAVASALSEKFIEELTQALGGNHWLVAEERAYLYDFQRFRNQDAIVQSELKEALSAQSSAGLLMKGRQFEAAKDLLTEKAIPIWEKYANDGIHHEIAAHYCALMYHHLGDFHSARLWAAKATRQSRELFGEDHIIYGIRVLTEGAIDLGVKDHHSAEVRFAKASEILSKNCPKQHVMLGLSYAYRTVLYLETNKYEKALLFAQRTTDNTEIRSLPEDKNQIALNFGVVAVHLMKARRHREADIALNALLETAENPVARSPNAALADYYQLKAINYRDLDRPDDAQKAQRKASEYRRMPKALER
jgi:hypothetical protein